VNLFPIIEAIRITKEVWTSVCCPCFALSCFQDWS